MSARRALAYFTILPGGVHDGPPDAATIAWFPFAGAFLGAFCGLGGWLAWRYAGAPWQAVVPFVLAIVLTGALHVDGFLD